MAAQQRMSVWTVLTIVVGIIAGIIALPTDWKPWAPAFLKPELHLGLDLAGGTQLDFRISEDEINARKAQLQKEIDALSNGGDATKLNAKRFELQSVEQQHRTLVEAIRTVLERRINSLGVSEATITPSYFGDEKHLLVECPGVVDIQRCIDTVGKTIQLEFKEVYNGPADEYAKGVRTKADAVFRQVTTGTGSLRTVGQDLSSTLGVSYVDSQSVFLSALPKGLELLANRKPTDPPVKVESTVQTTVETDQGMQVRDVKGIYIAQVLSPKRPGERTLTNPPDAFDAIRAASPADTSVEHKIGVPLSSAPQDIQSVLTTAQVGSLQTVTLPNAAIVLYVGGRVEGQPEMTASHILIQYKGASRADAAVTRTKEEAYVRARGIKQQLDANGGKNFTELARKESDGPSKQQAGSLGVIRKGVISPEFDAAAFALTQGQISEIVETPFGFHIIRADKAATTPGTTVTYDAITFQGDNATARADEALKRVQNGEVKRMDEQLDIRMLFLSLEPTGWQDTDLDGKHFRSAAVTTDNVGRPEVQIQFDEEGGKLFEELTGRNVGKQIAIFVGGELVSAPTVSSKISGQTAVINGVGTFENASRLAQDLNTGAIPAPIYLSGQSTVEATLGTDALKQSVYAGFVGLAVLSLAMILIYRLLGVAAVLALYFFVILFVAALKLPVLLISNQHVVLTLAGIAGIILTIGMAVDANVLVFERMKEEMRKGKGFKTSLDVGFKRAWPSIRDGNSSTLITAAILFTIGTSIIRGFSVTLVMGIFISLFTALVVTRWIINLFAKSPLLQRPEMIGVKVEQRQ